MAKFYSFTTAGRRLLPNHWDLIALAAIMAVLAGIARTYHGITAPLPAANTPIISLDYWALPYYALRTALRMFAALAASLVFTFTYATLAAKSRRARNGAHPACSTSSSRCRFSAFCRSRSRSSSALFPGATCSAPNARRSSRSSPARPGTWPFASISRCARCRAISTRSRRGFRLTGWQKFWQLEAPFAVPGLIWNTMMSMSGGWFFVVAAEAITVGDTTITLPGVGSYIAAANDAGRWDAISPPSRPWRSSFCSTISSCSGRSSPGRRSSASSCRSARRSNAPGCSSFCSAPTGSDSVSGRSSLRCVGDASGRCGFPVLLPAGALAPTPAASRSSRRRLDRHRRRDRAVRRCRSVVAYVGTELGWPDVVDATLLDVLHVAARRRADGAGDAVLGADQRLDRPEAALGRSGSADRAVPRGVPRQSAVRRRGQPRADLPSQSGHLAERTHRVRHAVVHRLQHDRRRGGLSQRSARGGDEFPRARLGLVAAGRFCRASLPTI